MRPTLDRVLLLAANEDAREEPIHAVSGDHDSAAAEHGVAESIVIYAVITPSGELRMCAADSRVSVDEWGALYQDGLWAAVHDDVDPYRGEVNGVALEVDMRAKVADAAVHDPENHSPNPVASTVLTALRHEPRHWSGTIAIVGREDDDGITASLTSEQRAAIINAHRLAAIAQRQTA